MVLIKVPLLSKRWVLLWRRVTSCWDEVFNPWGHNFFPGRGVWPELPKCGARELIFASERGVLWTEIFKFGGLRTKMWPKFEAVEMKISNCELTFKLFCLKWDPCELWQRREKGVFRAAHPHTPFLGQCPLGFNPLHVGVECRWQVKTFQKIFKMFHKIFKITIFITIFEFSMKKKKKNSQMSTNKPSIGSVVIEIARLFCEMLPHFNFCILK